MTTFQTENPEQSNRKKQTPLEHQDRFFDFQEYQEVPRSYMVIRLTTALSQIETENKNELNNECIVKANYEYDVQNKIESEYVVKNIDIFYTELAIVIVQEEYKSILANFELPGLSFHERIEIFECIAMGVRDLEASSICHRSLSPLSICIFYDGETYSAKINCFETAVKLLQKKSYFNSKGSSLSKKTKNIYAYVAPELKIDGEYSYSADIWSLGVLLNYLLYETVSNIKSDYCEVTINMPNGTPEWLKELLRNMLSFEPSHRYGINTILDILKVSLKFSDTIGKFLCLDISEPSNEGEVDEK